MPDGGVPSLHEQYRAELARTSLRLSFSGDLEDRFLAHQEQRTIWLLRFGCLVAVGLYLAFFVMDVNFQRRLDEPWIYLLVFGVACPATVLPALATFYAPWQGRARHMALAAIILNAAVLILVIVLKTRQGREFPYEVLILSLMYAFFLGGVLFRIAFPVACAAVVLYLVGEWLAGIALHPLLDRIFVLWGMLVLGGTTCYLLERAERRSWLRARLVEQLAIIDDMTGLSNRRAFYERTEALLREGRREGKNVALAIVDVDHFKAYNDSRGHLAGDRCLKEVADVLAGFARRPLDLTARLGGEEFAVVWYGASAEAAANRAEELRAAIEWRHLSHPAAAKGHVTISVGVSVAGPGEAMTVEQLVDAADRALYRAKTDGRNRVCAAAA